MGTLRSETDHTGLVVNGITLGDPARDVDKDGGPAGEYRWDDARLPNGTINENGDMTLDEVDE
jgi:hypothetical protein